MCNQVKQPSTIEFFEQFSDEKSARDYLINSRWPDGIICIHCGHDEVYRMRDGALLKCKSCRKQFTVRVGTVMEDSGIPLRKWLYGMYLFGIHSKGISSVKLKDHLGITQKSAWHMLHRMRRAFEPDGTVLSGTVEVDETYVGGKERNKHASKRKHLGRGGIGKQAVLGMKQRDGDTVAFPIEHTDQKTLTGAVKTHVSTGSKVFTDEHKGYKRLGKDYQHKAVKHSAGEYVNGGVHTNGIESVWALVKRAHYGIYHQWSAKHGHRYVSEIATRQSFLKLPAFDSSDGSGISMVRLFMAGMEGKRLTYAELIA